MANAHCEKRCRKDGSRKVHGDGGFFGISYGIQEGTKYFQQVAERAEFLGKMKDINAMKLDVPAKAGYAVEAFHLATYNVDAIKKGNSMRAEYAPACHPSTDLMVGTEGVQIKCGQSKYLKMLNHPKYDGVQKVVQEELADPSKGRQDHFEAYGAKSKPLSRQGAQELVTDPCSAETAIPIEPLPKTVARAGLEGAVGGGLLGAACNGLATGLSGGDNMQVVRAVREGAVEGAVTGGLASTATTALVGTTGDAVLGAVGGGVVASLVSAGFNMNRCSVRLEPSEVASCQTSELRKGGASAVSVAAGTVLGGPVGGFVASLGTRYVWDMYVRWPETEKVLDSYPGARTQTLAVSRLADVLDTCRLRVWRESVSVRLNQILLTWNV